MSKNLSELSARKGLTKNLFKEFVQRQSNVQKIAKNYLIGKSSVKGAISFYDFLKSENKAKKVYVCDGTACLCAGTQDLLLENLEMHFKPEEIGHMTCLGRCHENSAFQYQGLNYSALEKNELEDLFSGTQPSGKESYHVEALGTALLTAPLPGLEVVYQQLLTMMDQGKDGTLEQIKKSGLRGRGGAGFPIGIKLESVRQSEADSKFIICNADEGDPGAYSDRYLLEQKTHLVLFGMLVAGYVTGAQEGVLYIRGEYPESILAVEHAITELQGLDIYQQLPEFDFHVIAAQGAYICGEETALINSIEGQRPEVRVRPPFPSEQGLFNRPTVVNNVETLASLYAICCKGGDAYAYLGTAKSNGTKLLSLDSSFNRPGIFEVEMGTDLSVVFNQLGGGFKKPVKAVHIGGPLGGLIPLSKVKYLTVDFESFSSQGFLLGHASVIGVPEKLPMIEYLYHLFQFAAYESCGKCFPCRIGTKRGEEMLERAIKNYEPIDLNLFNDLLNTLEQGSLCAHGGGIPLPVRNAMHYFKEELSNYFPDKGLKLEVR